MCETCDRLNMEVVHEDECPCGKPVYLGFTRKTGEVQWVHLNPTCADFDRLDRLQYAKFLNAYKDSLRSLPS